MQKVIRFCTSFLLLIIVASFVSSKKDKVQWLTVAELQAAYRKQPKPILVDVYTSWCGWCKVMDRETYSRDNVAAYINEKYYAVKLDAEANESLEWGGKKYGYNAAYKSNDLAIYLLGGQMSFPTTVFMTTLEAQPAALPGYLKPKELEGPLRFFGDGVYKNKNFQEYMKSFAGSW